MAAGTTQLGAMATICRGRMDGNRQSADEAALERTANSKGFCGSDDAGSVYRALSGTCGSVCAAHIHTHLLVEIALTAVGWTCIHVAMTCRGRNAVLHACSSEWRHLTVVRVVRYPFLLCDPP